MLAAPTSCCSSSSRIFSVLTAEKGEAVNVAYLEMKHSSPSNKFKLSEVHHTAVDERKSIA